MSNRDKMLGMITGYNVKPVKDGGRMVTIALAVAATDEALALAGQVGVMVEASIQPVQGAFGEVPSDPRAGKA